MKNAQDEVQPRIRLYKVHKHNNIDTIIICTNISIQTPLEDAHTY